MVLDHVATWSPSLLTKPDIEDIMDTGIFVQWLIIIMCPAAERLLHKWKMGWEGCRGNRMDWEGYMYIGRERAIEVE